MLIHPLVYLRESCLRLNQFKKSRKEIVTVYQDRWIRKFIVHCNVEILMNSIVSRDLV